MKKMILKEMQIYECYDNPQEAIEKYPNLVRQVSENKYQYRIKEDDCPWIAVDFRYEKLLIYNDNLLKDLKNGVFYWCAAVSEDRINLFYKEI